MKNYKGYYIDKVIFNNEQEIDEFIKAQAVKAYKTAVQIFVSHSTIEASIYCDEKAERLIKDFGFTPTEVEEIEIEVMQSIA